MQSLRLTICLKGHFPQKIFLYDFLTYLKSLKNDILSLYEFNGHVNQYVQQFITSKNFFKYKSTVVIMSGIFDDFVTPLHINANVEALRLDIRMTAKLIFEGGANP